MTVEHDYPTFHITIHCYMCTLVNGNLTLSEHNDSVWLEKAKLLELDWAEADMPVVKELIK